jgi:tetratricopeptide (TPR) repeat protein
LRGAIEKYKTALEINPRAAWVAHSWGNALNRLDDRTGAIEKYKEALAIDPRFAPAYASWGTVLADEGLTDAAIEKCREALAIDPQMEWLRNYLDRLQKKAE